ncbi:putative TauD/TfdA-like domain, taurine dioxygenase TauD-like superfamily [Helianthus anomalus]
MLVMCTISKMTTGKFFKEVELPEQKPYDNGAEKSWLESNLQRRGVILFRGFHVTSPSDFNRVVEAFGYPELVYAGGRATRTKVVGRVYTANESPPEMKIPFHHEMSYVCKKKKKSSLRFSSRWFVKKTLFQSNSLKIAFSVHVLPDFPSKLFFFCEEEPESRGETPVVLSHIVYEQMKEKQPEFVAKVEEHGLKFIIVTGDEDQSSSIGGRGWKSTYMTDDKTIANERFNLINLTPLIN